MHAFYMLHHFNKHSCHVPLSVYHIQYTVLLTELGQSSLFGWKLNTALASDHSPHNFLLLPPLQVNKFVSTDPINNVDMPVCILLSETERDISAWKTGKGSLQMYLLI